MRLVFGIFFGRLFHRFSFDFWSPWAWKIIKKWWKGEQNQGFALFSLTAFSEQFSDDFGMIFGTKNRWKFDEKMVRKLIDFWSDFLSILVSKLIPNRYQNRFKICKKTLKNRSWELLGALGPSWIDFLSIFIDFGLHLGALLGGFGMSWGAFWRFLALLGPLGKSFGASWRVLGAVGLISHVFL